MLKIYGIKFAWLGGDSVVCNLGGGGGGGRMVDPKFLFKTISLIAEFNWSEKPPQA